MKLRIYMQAREWQDSTAIYIVGEDENGRRMYVKPMVIVTVHEEEGKIAEPSLVLHGDWSRQFFPALVQALSESGYRYESSDAGELKATKEHLADMRKLTFDLVPRSI